MVRRSLSGSEMTGDCGAMGKIGQRAVRGVGERNRAGQPFQAPGVAMIAKRGRKVGHLQRAFGMERVEAVDAVLQLADVARPVVGVKGFEEFLAGFDAAQAGGVAGVKK